MPDQAQQPAPSPVIDEETTLARDVLNKDGKPKYLGCRDDETVAQYRARLLERLRKGRETAARNREEKRRDKERQEREKREKEQEKLKKAIVRKQAEMDRLMRAMQGKEVRDIKDVDLVLDILWVYENLRAKKADATTAPGQGALWMLEWAKDHPDEFYNKMVVKALAMQEVRERAIREREQRGAGNGQGKANDLPLAELERLLRQFGGEEVGADEGRQA